jgi:hypothetical protein
MQPFRVPGMLSEKSLGEQSWKLANFVRHPNLLITKVSVRKCPSVP